MTGQCMSFACGAGDQQQQPGQSGQGDIEAGPGVSAAAPSAGAPLPWGLSAMLPPGDSKDPTEGTTLSYEHAFKVRMCCTSCG